MYSSSSRSVSNIPQSTTENSSSDLVNVSTSSYEEGSHDSFVADVAHWIWVICPPIIVCLGTFGNIASIAILQRLSAKGHHSALNVYLGALAISDLSQLYMGNLTFWVSEVFGHDLYLYNDVFCKVLTWLEASASVVSIWILSAITAQRAASVLWPHRASTLFTRHRSLVVVVTMIVLLFLLHIHFLVTTAIVVHPFFGLECGVSPEFQEFRQYVWSIVFTILHFFPTGVIILSNVLLLKQLFSSLRTNRLELGDEQVSARERKVSSITMTLVVLSAAFCFLNFPLFINVLAHEWGIFQSNWNLITDAVTFQMWYANSAVNFYLYCLTGSKFRAEFVSMMKEWGGRVAAVLVCSCC